MKSIPVAVKVGSAGVLGGGGIAGTGLLIHNQLQKTSKEENYKLTGLDEVLVQDENTVLKIEGEFNISTANQAILVIKAVAANGKTSQFTTNQWSCTIKGIITEPPSVTLTDNNNFNTGTQKTKFTDQLTKKEGLVKSCARNRTLNTSTTTSPLTSEIVVKLKKETAEGEDKDKWVFNRDDVVSIFAGSWNNQKQK